MKLGLQNVSEFLELVGSPQTKYPSIHISGTNGKGSCVTMLASILTAAGYRTGLFTSPHLVSPRERIKVDGRMIHPASVTAFVDRFRPELTRRKISFFELFASMAFWHFERSAVDIAVIETGLGGRLDATNVLQPMLTITTDISRDHVEILGHSLRKIAWEKAGIIKPGIPHLIGMLPDVASREMARVSRSRGSDLWCLHQREIIMNPAGAGFDFADANLSLSPVKPPLDGRHQVLNTALVIKAVGLLRRKGLKISKRAVSEGLRLTDWPGRFQIRRRRGQPTVVLDVAHNERGMEALVRTFQQHFPNRKAHVLTGFVKRKPHQQMFNHLASIATSYALVPLATHRSVDLHEMIADTDFSGVPWRRFGSLRTGYPKLASQATSDDIILVVGSHYLVGEFIKRFGP
ncbi:MAG: folylpolyglutamate synthase/dihydrofolate synthase family protein [bacterium]